MSSIGAKSLYLRKSCCYFVGLFSLLPVLGPQ